MLKSLFSIFSKSLSQSKAISLRFEALIQSIKNIEKNLPSNPHKLSHAAEVSYTKLLNSKSPTLKKIEQLNKYEARIREVLDHLSLETYELGINLAEIPQRYNADLEEIEEAQALEAHILGAFRSKAYQIENSKKAHVH